MEREACVCDHGYERSDLCAEIIIIIIISMTNKEIIQYTSVLFTQAPIRVCLDGTIIDSRTILVTMYYCCGYVTSGHLSVVQ